MPLGYGTAVSSASYTIEDFNGQTASFNVSAADAAKVKAGLDFINAVTGAAVKAVNVTTKEPVTTGANSPGFGHQREYRGIIECILDDGTSGKIVIPAPVVGILSDDDKRYIDLTKGGMPDLVTWLTTGANGVTIGGKQVTAVKQAYVSHKESSTQVEKLKIG